MSIKNWFTQTGINCTMLLTIISTVFYFLIIPVRIYNFRTMFSAFLTFSKIGTATCSYIVQPIFPKILILAIVHKEFAFRASEEKYTIYMYFIDTIYII